MEFDNLVNRYLRSDPEARRRELYIRTYVSVDVLDNVHGSYLYYPQSFPYLLPKGKPYTLENAA